MFLSLRLQSRGSGPSAMRHCLSDTARRLQFLPVAVHISKQGKEENDYHRRSLAETTMFRMMTTFGDELSARSIENQATETFVRCQILNRMNQMGKPDAYRVESA